MSWFIVYVEPYWRESMSRSENIAVVESYLNGLASKDLSSVPFAPDITFEGPLMPKLAGRETIVGFLTSILPFIKGIEIKQHLVDGDYVVTVFDMETVNGVDHVVDLCLVAGGLLTEVRAFYYPGQDPR
jgi:SnoaL-like domain